MVSVPCLPSSAQLLPEGVLGVWGLQRVCRKCAGHEELFFGHTQMIKACRAPGPLAMSALSAEELALLEAMMARLGRCAKAAFEVQRPLDFSGGGVAEGHHRNANLLPSCLHMYLPAGAVPSGAVSQNLGMQECWLKRSQGHCETSAKNLVETVISITHLQNKVPGLFISYR